MQYNRVLRKELAFQPLQKSDKHKSFDGFYLSKLPEFLEGKL